MSVTPSCHPARRLRQCRRAIRWLLAGIPAVLLAAEAVRRSFDIPAATAEQSLRLFSAQSGVQLIYPSAVVRDVQTKAVKGRFTDREALDRLVASTPLRIVRDEKTRAFTITRADDAATTAEKTRPTR